MQIRHVSDALKASHPDMSPLPEINPELGLSEAVAERLLQLPSAEALRLLEERNLCPSPLTPPIGYYKWAPLFLTNVCELQPSLYAYPKNRADQGVYCYSIDDIDFRLESAKYSGYEAVFLIAGFHSGLRIAGLDAASYFQTVKRLLTHFQERYPDLSLIGFSPDELNFLHELTGRSYPYLLDFLKDYGLRMMSGHLGDYLSDRVRSLISSKLMPVRDWWAIQELAATKALPACVNFGYGFLETIPEKIHALRTLRDFAKRFPGHFKTVFPLPYTDCMEQSAFWGLETFSLESCRVHQMLLYLFLKPHFQDFPLFWLPAPKESAAQTIPELLLWGANHLGSTADLPYRHFLLGNFRQAALPETMPLSFNEMAQIAKG